MDVDGNYRRIAIIAIVLVGLAVGPITALGTQSQPTLSLVATGDSTGDTTTMEVQLSEVPKGIAGYSMTLNVTDTSSATITNASTASEFTAPGGDAVSIASDGSSVYLTGADLREALQPGATNVTLATVTLTGQASSSTDLYVSQKNIDDDDGNDITAQIGAGLTTSGTAPETTPAGTATPGGEMPEMTQTPEPGTTSSGSGPGFGVAVGLVVLIGTTLLVARRPN